MLYPSVQAYFIVEKYIALDFFLDSKHNQNGSINNNTCTIYYKTGNLDSSQSELPNDQSGP